MDENSGWENKIELKAIQVQFKHKNFEIPNEGVDAINEVKKGWWK